jgi:hypothetical protein
MLQAREIAAFDFAFKNPVRPGFPVYQKVVGEAGHRGVIMQVMMVQESELLCQQGYA